MTRGAYKPDWHPSPDALKAWQAESAAHFAGLRAAGLREEMAAVTDKMQRLEAVATQARALLDALPRCSQCPAIAEWEFEPDDQPTFCARHITTSRPWSYRANHAAPAAALARLLDGLEGQ